MWAPKLDQTEGLHCIENGTRPETDGGAGLRVVRLPEAAEESMRARGKLVEI